MELSAVLHAGALAAIAANAFNSLIILIAARLRGTPYPTAQAYLLLLLLHLVAGIGVGLVFWLSWGLTAIIAVTWWQRGFAFAVLLWSVVCVPFGIHLLMSQREQWRSILGVTLQWFVTLMAVGLACAWSWSRGN
jgi:hypothetical protein